MASGKKSYLRKLDRRSLLKLSAGSLVLPGAILPQEAASQAINKSDDVDVVVIGAGIAGLAAARTLKDLGYDVVVLEATNQIGGRIKTDWSLGAPFDVGASWIHGPKGNPISKLARAVGARTFVTDDDSLQVFSKDGKPQKNSTVFNKEQKLLKLERKLDNTLDRDTSLAKAITRFSPNSLKDPITRWMLSAYTEFDIGAPIEQISAYYFDEDDVFDGADVILPGGYDEVIKPLAKGLDIRLNHPVDRVEYEAGDGASIFANGKEFEAHFVICTCPLGVLQNQGIEFDPPLPKKQTNSINRIGFGNVTKAALKFENAFWPQDVQYFGLMTEEKGRWNYFLNYKTFSDENILMGFSVGAYTEKVEMQADGVIMEDVMSAVRDMFGSEAPDPSDYKFSRWSQDPYTQGAYSFSKVGVKPADFDILQKPIEKTILFAGEHTTFKYHSTVHGAYLSGIRAAEIIDDELYE